MQVAPAERGVAKRMDCNATLSPSDAAETHSIITLTKLQLLSLHVATQVLDMHCLNWSGNVALDRWCIPNPPPKLSCAWNGLSLQEHS